VEEIFSWLVEERGKAKERMFALDRFYSIRGLVPSFVSFKKQFGFDKQALREANALQEIFTVEASSPYSTFIVHYANATHDPISDDFKRDVELLKRVLREHEIEYAQREKLVITQSKKHIYVKRGEGKVMLSGDTFPMKEELKKKGFKWDPLYKAWYKPERDVDLSRVSVATGL
jgi:hypothetical protein